MIPPCFYHFEKCEPEDVTYRLDYKNNAENEEYMQMVKDFGCLYFCKRVADAENINDGELFSDDVSRGSMIDHIVKTRLLLIAVIFLCCVISNAIRAFDSGVNAFFAIFWLIMLILYVYLLIHCGIKLKHLKDKMEE